MPPTFPAAHIRALQPAPPPLPWAACSELQEGPIRSLETDAARKQGHSFLLFWGALKHIIFHTDPKAQHC